MPPAAKKKKLRHTTSEESGAAPCEHTGANTLAVEAAVVVRCKQTRAYADAYDSMTLAWARRMNRRLETPKWYLFNKDDLVATLVVHQFAEKIQRFFRDIVVATGNIESNNNTSTDKKNVIRNKNENMCPISLVPMAEVSPRCRYQHMNTWFDRDVLALHIFKTCDFINPVTRVEFCEKDVLDIDPGLLSQYRNRKETRESIADKMAMIQSVENEMEEVFQTMVEAAEEVPSRREFSLVFSNLAEDFQECYNDFARLDRDRLNLVLKSLGDAIGGDPFRPIIMSRKRERILRSFLLDHS